jgi:hypothetical protein
MRHLAGCPLVVLFTAVLPSRAWADCAAPVTYGVTPTGATVQVCPHPYAGPDRPPCDSGGLLRVDSAGRAALLTTCDAEHCFVDECVPPGRYRYGLKNPYACSPHSCGTYYFVTADLTASAAGCQRALPAPTAYTGPLPWGSSNLVCDHQGPGPLFGCGSTGAGPVLGVNALAFLAGLLLWRSRRSARAA